MKKINMIRPIQIEDAKQIAEVYNHYILNTVVTFEETTVDVQEMGTRIEETNSQFLPWLVYEEEGQIIGYACASKWKSRCAYKHSAESTVYLKPDNTGRGIGTKLYEELIKQLKAMNLHAVIGGIALPNDSSIYLHEKFGFEKVAQFKEVGYKFQRWIDVGYWELILK